MRKRQHNCSTTVSPSLIPPTISVFTGVSMPI
ncbi:hypothetical protein ACVLHI_001352 [Paenibacillus sp. PvR053]